MEIQGIKEKIDETVNIYFLALLAVLAVSTFLRFRYAFFDGMWVDEGRYARLALDLASHPLDYSTDAPLVRSVGTIPPVYPYLLAISTYIFPNPDFAVRTVSPIMSVVAIGVTYKIGEQMRDRVTGLISASFLSLIPTFWFLSNRILVEATLTAVYAAAIFALYYGLKEEEYSRYAIYALGPLTALAIMTKQPAYTLGPVILLYFIYKRWEDIKELKKELNLDTARQKFGDLGISIGLGAVTISPWMINNMFQCGFPLCGLLKAISFTSSTETANASVFSVQSSFYFISNLPSIVTLPVAALVLFSVAHYLLDRTEKPGDLAIRAGIIIGMTAVAFLIEQKLAPMFLLTSIALLPKKDHEKLLWLWIGIGIGFMSLPAVKVNRYIAFVFPAIALVSTVALQDFSKWMEKISGEEMLNWAVLGGVLVLVMLVSFPVGHAQAKNMNNENSPVATMKPMGEWIDQNTNEDAKIVAPSNRQIMFYAYPRLAWFPQDNQSKFEQHLRDEQIDYVVADVYEKAQPNWMQYIPPYRIPNGQRQALSDRQISPRQVASNFGPPPDYLESVESFGQTKMPLTKNRGQPQFIVYEVNESALP